MCTLLLPLGVYPIAVKYIVSYHIIPIPLQAWTGPEGSRRMRFSDFKTIGT